MKWPRMARYNQPVPRTFGSKEECQWMSVPSPSGVRVTSAR